MFGGIDLAVAVDGVFDIHQGDFDIDVCVCGISLVAWLSHGSCIICELYFSIDTALLLRAFEYINVSDIVGLSL